MEIQDVLLNGISITGLISAIAFVIILCVKPLREKFTEYIILKHDKSKCEEILKKSKSKIETLESKIDTLIQENNDLKIQIAELRALIIKS